MNKYMSIFFRGVPLLMGAICFFYGIYVTELGEKLGFGFIVAGHVLIFLTSICIALFTTAATIIRQLINKYNKFYKFALPTLAYSVGIICMFVGIFFLSTYSKNAAYFVSGNIGFGIGLITCCVATVATTSTKFLLIPRNSGELKEGELSKGSFNNIQAKVLIAIPILCTIIGFSRVIYLLFSSSATPNFVAGSVLLGISLICASLISLVATIVRQIQNTFTNKERWKWSILVIAMGTISIIYGVIVLIIDKNSNWIAPGFVLIGLGLVCYSISSKVILLAGVWRKECELANRIPIIPVLTSLICLFIAAFLFEAEIFNIVYFIPARVMVGLGAVCFTLFSIVSILESGTSSSK